MKSDTMKMVVSIAMLVLTFAAIASAKADPCTELESFAKQQVANYQHGQGMPLEALVLYYNAQCENMTPQEHHACVDPNEQRRSIAIMASYLPIGITEVAKEKAATDFAADAFLDCHERIARMEKPPEY